MNFQIKIFSKFVRLTLWGTSAYLLLLSTVHAQGQDGTPADRDIMILGEMLPGSFRNANQAYFDVRLKVAEELRHKSVYVSFKVVEAAKFGDYVFSSEFGESSGKSAPRYFLHSLEVDYEQAAVRMKNYVLSKPADKSPKLKSAEYLPGCDLLWRQEAGQFRASVSAGASTQECDQTDLASDIQLTEDALWYASRGTGISHYALDRARSFSCYIDVPGVGGGRDIPYERFQLENMHDLGAEQWITTKDGQEIGVSLFRVQWTMNNYDGIFTRPSFVIYAKTREEDGAAKEVGYAFTEPRAQRIGINLKWMLANCYMISNEDVTPFFRIDEPLL